MSEIDEVAALIRATVSQARTAHFMTSDLNVYGFRLSRLCDEFAGEVGFPDFLFEAVDELLHDVPWDGPMRENARGYAVLDLVTGRTAPDGK